MGLYLKMMTIMVSMNSCSLPPATSNGKSELIKANVYKGLCAYEKIKIILGNNSGTSFSKIA